MNESPNFPDCFYRVTVKGLCVREGKLLLVREDESHNHRWELPGGGLDFGESPLEALPREVAEEMGLTVTKMSKRPVYAWTHRLDHDTRLKWFYSCVLTYRIELEHLDFTPSDECQELAWFSEEEVKKLPLTGQMTELPDYFRAADFAEDF